MRSSIVARAQHLRDEITPIATTLGGLIGLDAPDDELDAVRRDAALLFAQLVHVGNCWRRTSSSGDSAFATTLAALCSDPDAALPDNLNRISGNTDGTVAS